jgi:hypothetical protein
MLGERCEVYQEHMFLTPQVALMRKMKSDPLTILLQLQRQQGQDLA